MRLLLIAILLLAGAFTFPLSRAEASVSSQATIQAGHLAARGRGTIALDATGALSFELFGEGALVIPNSDDFTVRIVGTGVVRKTDQGTLFIRSFRGHVHIVGRDIHARFGEGRVTLHARGRGRALLKGLGGFNANGTPGQWSAAGTPVRW